ncbi:MAG: 50S ribosomal protein L29 [bacterium]|nr:50S ribosomal protein L29 [bacterium]
MKRVEENKTLRGSSVEELESKVSGWEEELMKLRFRKVTGQLNNPALVGAIKKSIARAKTVIAENKIAQAE